MMMIQSSSRFQQQQQSKSNSRRHARRCRSCFFLFFLQAVLLPADCGGSKLQTALAAAAVRPAATITAVLVGYWAYNKALNHVLRAHYLRLQLLAVSTAVPSDPSKNNNDDNASAAAASIRDLLYRAAPRFVAIDNERSEKKTRFVDEDYQILWEGKFPSEVAGNSNNASTPPLLRDGTYSIGRDEELLIQIQEKEQRASVSLRRQQQQTTSSSRSSKDIRDLLALRKGKGVSIVEDLREKLAWQHWLIETVTGSGATAAATSRTGAGKEERTNGAMPPESTLPPGRYGFSYRECVDFEEFAAMLASRGGFSKIRFSKPSVFVVEQQQRCYMEDYGCLFGIVPVRTHNTGRIVADKKTKQLSIEWEASSVRLGLSGDNPFGKTLEIPAVTKILRAAPWPLRMVKTTEEPEAKQETGSKTKTGTPPRSILLMNRPSKGWLVFPPLSD